MIIYIHGFNSIGGGEKFLKLKELFPNIDIYSPTYDSSNFNTIDNLMNDLTLDENLLFIGNSLGGFISMYLAKKYKAKCILLNPTTDPIAILTKNIGDHINLKTNQKYTLTQKNINILKKYYIDIEESINISVYVNEDDNIIDYNETVSFFNNKLKVNVLKNGGHRFTNLNDIKSEILSIYNQI